MTPCNKSLKKGGEELVHFPLYWRGKEEFDDES